MKAFLMSVAILCIGGILLSVLAYATGNLPTPDHLRPVAQQVDPSCPPCVDKLALVLEEWEDMMDVAE